MSICKACGEVIRDIMKDSHYGPLGLVHYECPKDNRERILDEIIEWWKARKRKAAEDDDDPGELKEWQDFDPDC